MQKEMVLVVLVEGACELLSSTAHTHTHTHTHTQFPQHINRCTLGWPNKASLEPTHIVFEEFVVATPINLPDREHLLGSRMCPAPNQVGAVAVLCS